MSFESRLPGKGMSDLSDRRWANVTPLAEIQNPESVSKSQKAAEGKVVGFKERNSLTRANSIKLRSSEHLSRTLTGGEKEKDSHSPIGASLNSGKHPKEKRHILQTMDMVDRLTKQEQKRTIALEHNLLRLRALEVTQHRHFSFFIGGIIAVNAIHIGIETNHEANRPPGESSDGDHWLIIEILFALTFLLELVLRLFAERCQFFFDGWNCFDLVLVACSCLDTFVLAFVGNGQHMNIISILRIMRLVRLARIFRLLRFFKELWLLVTGIAGAMRTLSWAFLLLGVIIYVGAILLTRTIGQPHADEDPEIAMYFGSLEVTMFTLFQVMTLEGWGDICRIAMVHEPWAWIIFVLFLSMTTFAIMNIVVAVIVENTVEQATKQKEDVQKKAEAEQRRAAQKICDIFVAADADGNGEVTKEEFCSAMERDDVMLYLQQIGIDVRQAENLFDILDYDESGSLDAQEFSNGVMKARGEAKARDLLTVQCDLWRYEQKFRKDLYELCENLHGQCNSVDEEVALIKEDLLRILGSNFGAVANGEALSPAPPHENPVELPSFSNNSERGIRQ